VSGHSRKAEYRNVAITRRSENEQPAFHAGGIASGKDVIHVTPMKIIIGLVHPW
jgi:hypothetical protein